MSDETAKQVCDKCGGSGKYYYSSGGTYDTTPGIIVTHAFTWDVCDKCWGTGDSSKPGENLLVKKLQNTLARYHKEDSKLYLENRALKEMLNAVIEQTANEHVSEYMDEVIDKAKKLIHR